MERRQRRYTLLAYCLCALLLALSSGCTGASNGSVRPSLSAPAEDDGKPRGYARVEAPWVNAGIGRLGAVSYDPPPDAIFVAARAVPSAADGSRERPWPSIQQAVDAAPDGATVAVRAGSYHESVRWSGRRLTLQPYRRERVWFDGSVPLHDWVRSGNTWRLDGWTYTFDRQPAFDALDPRRPLAAWPEMVFLDGRPLRQVAKATDVTPGTFHVDLAGQALVLGSDPRGREVRGSTLARALTIRNAAGSVVRGIGVRRYATPFDQVAAIAGFSDGLVFDRVISEDNATNGLSVIGRESRVSRSAFRRNGQMGLHAHNVVGLSVTGNWLQGNNVEGFRHNFAQGGMKVTRGRDMRWEGNLVSANQGDGMWCDIGCTDVEIVNNVVVDNAGRGIKYEISARGVIASNRIADNAGGILVHESSDVLVYNNVVQGSGVAILALEGKRSGRPGHVPQDVVRVVLRNNIVGTRSAGTPLVALSGAIRKPLPRRVDADFDIFIAPPGSSARALVRLPSREGLRVADATSLESLRARTGQEAHGHTVADADAAQRTGPGAPLPARVATAVGAEGGTPVPPGLIGTVPPPRVLGER